MKAKYFLLLLLFFPVVAVAQDSTVAGDLDQGVDLPALVKRCEGCHGHNGNSVRDGVPDLAGKASGVIEASITQFYYYERHCPAKIPDGGNLLGFPLSMCDIANTLSKKEIQTLAQFFEAQPVVGTD